MSIQFSIIIPCYNAIEYVDRALESVVDQILDRSLFEVIAIDDASTDETLRYLRRWADRYPDTVKVISYDTNLRQGGARNVGIRKAVGEYICFLDADDWMERDALQSFSEALSVDKYDIVTAKHEEDYEYFGLKDKSSLFFDGDSNETERKSSIIETFGREDIRDYISFNLGFVWASVYKKSIITDNNVWFPEHLAYEDVHWQRLIKFYAEKACVIDRVTHHHYNHPLSTMNRKNAAHHIDRLTCYEMLLREYSDRNLLRMYYDQIMNDTIETYLFNSYYMFFTMMDDIPDVYDRIRTTIYSYFPDWENSYDDSEIPMVFQYLLKFLKKAVKATPADLQPFKDSVLEIIKE